jgi:hypothetical protein
MNLQHWVVTRSRGHRNGILIAITSAAVPGSAIGHDHA